MTMDMTDQRFTGLPNIRDVISHIQVFEHHECFLSAIDGSCCRCHIHEFTDELSSEYIACMSQVIAAPFTTLSMYHPPTQVTP